MDIKKSEDTFLQMKEFESEFKFECFAGFSTFSKLISFYFPNGHTLKVRQCQNTLIQLNLLGRVGEKLTQFKLSYG